MLYAGDADVEQFLDPGLYPAWAANPLAVSCHPGRFARCDKAAALCSNDASCVPPIRRMQVRGLRMPAGAARLTGEHLSLLQDRAYSMLASRAFVHQYEKYGLSEQDFQSCFAQVEDIVERYRAL